MVAAFHGSQAMPKPGRSNIRVGWSEILKAISGRIQCAAVKRRVLMPGDHPTTGLPRVVEFFGRGIVAFKIVGTYGGAQPRKPLLRTYPADPSRLACCVSRLATVCFGAGPWSRGDAISNFVEFSKPTNWIILSKFLGGAWAGINADCTVAGQLIEGDLRR